MLAACLLDLQCLKTKVRYPYVKYTFGYDFQFCILLNPVMVMMSSDIPLMPISQAIFGYMHTWCFHGMQCLFLKPFLAINMVLP